MHRYVRDQLKARTVDAQTPVLKETANRTVRLASTMRTEVRALTEAILEDQSLTARVLAVANSVFYSHRDEPTTTVHRAVLDMGYNAIRDIALAAELVELLRERSPAGLTVKRILARALVAAHCARVLGTAAAWERHEDLYTTSLLQSFDELVLACFLPDAYAQLETTLRAGRPREQAYAEALGAAPESLLPEVLEICGLPRDLAACPPDWGRAERWRERERIDGLALVANDLARLYFRSAISPTDTELTRLLTRLAGACRIRQARIEGLLREAFAEARAVGRCLTIEPECFLPTPADPAAEGPGAPEPPPLFRQLSALARSWPSASTSGPGRPGLD